LLLLPQRFPRPMGALTGHAEAAMAQEIQRRKLTNRVVDSIQATSKDEVHWDAELPRFGLRVKPSGTKTFVVQYRNAAGRTRKLALGQVGVLTPEEARQRARRALLRVADGMDPSADRQAKRKDLTVAQLVEVYLKDGPADKPTKKASSWVIDASNLRRHAVPLLGRRSVGTLTMADVQRFQREVTEGKTKADLKTGKRGRARVSGGPGTAARTTSVLAAMLAWAARHGYCDANPAKGVKLNAMRNRERFLTGVELRRLGDAMSRGEREGLNTSGLAIIRLLVLTGARRNEIASLKWEYVDFERRALRLPDSKTGAKIVPLGAPALAVLSKRPRKDGVPWVFPAERGRGHFVGTPPVWRRLVALARLAEVRIHDLRHGFASVAVADQASLYLVGKILGHTQAKTTERYSHLQLDPLHAVADRTARKIAVALEGRKKGAAQVVQLRASRS
jgi:integrase